MYLIFISTIEWFIFLYYFAADVNTNIPQNDFRNMSYTVIAVSSTPCLINVVYPLKIFSILILIVLYLHTY